MNDLGLWGWIAWFFWVFVFFAYLMVLFSILSDLFRDHKLNGWLKAVWIIFLIFVPFLTALVYLIARGNGMTKRGMAQAAEMRKAQDEYIRTDRGDGIRREQRGRHREGEVAPRLGRHHAGGVRRHQVEGTRRLSPRRPTEEAAPSARTGRLFASSDPRAKGWPNHPSGMTTGTNLDTRLDPQPTRRAAVHPSYGS